MPKKTIYVRDEDLPLWTEAQKELGQSLSAMFADCLRERLQKARIAGSKTMDKITIVQWNEEDDPVVHKSFTGRWLVPPHRDQRADDDSQNWDAGACYGVAETQKGAIAVYCFHCNDGWAPAFDVYDNLEQLKGKVPQNIISAAAHSLGIRYEMELDI